MKKLFSFIILIFTGLLLFAQVPQKFNYQAVVRDAGNGLVSSQTVGVRISILLDDANGTVVYQETHAAVTNVNGLMTLQVGGGIVQNGDFSTIDWANGTYFLKTEIDPTGGTNYTVEGAQQLLSVPYALYAGNMAGMVPAECGDTNVCNWLVTLQAHVDALQHTVDSLSLLGGGTGGGATGQDALPCPGTPTLTDADGNVYNTVQIGQQCWMRENLRTTHYADNTSIPVGSTYSYTDPYRYAPNNDESNVAIYGYLYNWAAVMHGATSSSANPSGAQGICPTGWHVPSYAEWTQLTDYVSSESQYVCSSDNRNIAKALSNTMGWIGSTEICAVGNCLASNNATGFGVLPAGYYHNTFSNMGASAYIYSSTETGTYTCYHCSIYYGDSDVMIISDGKSEGRSVRCLRN